ncbi:ankyrin repeat domain-containing protein [Aquimarina hainanensis]|uniref:Ankyrin repeat domain-containing protein n=1 Tax=Aquimarina hainanensis TaxID=1578017 RepID=A0ABW5N4W0_9FLAO
MNYKITLFTSLLCLFSQFSIAQDISKELLLAIRNGDTETLNTHVTADELDTCFSLKNSQYNYLAISIKTNSLTAIKYFIEKGANIERICTTKTPLMYAVKSGNIAIVKYLISKGANIDAQTPRGATAIDYADKYKQTEIKAYLSNL